MRPETVHMASVGLARQRVFPSRRLYVPYLQSLSCTIGDIFLANVCPGAIAGMEVPTGFIADRYGRGGSVA